MQKKRYRSGNPLVYSTNPDYHFPQQDPLEETPAPPLQQLRVTRDRRQRAGKTVTLVEGFTGSRQDLEKLGRELKTACGTGGSVKEGIILLQGDWLEKVKSLLKDSHYRVSG